jgi:ribonuclease III
MNSNLEKKFQNKKFFNQAFIHRSYLNEHKKENIKSNERLEFLGDAVLELVVSWYLFKKYPRFPEGKLTALRAMLVQTKTLSLASQRLRLGEKLKLSKGEQKSKGKKNPSILANTFEAVVGALYLDQGFDKAYQFVVENLLEPAKKLFANKLPKDYKSQLQELVQSQRKPSPVYKVLKSYGPDHSKTFEVGCFAAGKRIGEGKGRSKQEAEQQAAKKALANLRLKT